MRNVFGGASNNEGTGLLAACFDWNYIGGDVCSQHYTPLPRADIFCDSAYGFP